MIQLNCKNVELGLFSWEKVDNCTSFQRNSICLSPSHKMVPFKNSSLFSRWWSDKKTNRL